MQCVAFQAGGLRLAIEERISSATAIEIRAQDTGCRYFAILLISLSHGLHFAHDKPICKRSTYIKQTSSLSLVVDQSPRMATTNIRKSIKVLREYVYDTENAGQNYVILHCITHLDKLKKEMTFCGAHKKGVLRHLFHKSIGN